MPWKETCTMDQRMLFIVDYLSGGYTKKGLCRHYGISRPTGDKWIDRYRIHGPEGLMISREDPVAIPTRRHRRSLSGSSRRSWRTRALDPRR